MLVRIVIFLLINFAALGIGSYFTGPGVDSEWYQTMAKAPWTPPGWVFGAAWTTIMICFSIYMAIIWEKLEDKQALLSLYGSQLILNVMWNPIFFYMQQTVLALVCISALTLLILYIMTRYWAGMKVKSLLLAPYAVWLCIATSLNLYAVLMN